MVFEALRNAVGRSESDSDIAADRANVLLAAVLGLHLTARTAATTGEVQVMVAGLCRQLDEWRATSR